MLVLGSGLPAARHRKVTICARVQGSLGPAFSKVVGAANPGLSYSQFGDGSLRSTSKQWLAGLELNYDITPQLELTSVTGLYDLSFFNVGNFSATNRPDAILGSMNNLYITEIS